jgi:hypothetical protein
MTLPGSSFPVLAAAAAAPSRSAAARGAVVLETLAVVENPAVVLENPAVVEHRAVVDQEAEERARSPWSGSQVRGRPRRTQESRG